MPRSASRQTTAISGEVGGIRSALMKKMAESGTATTSTASR